MKRIMAFGLFFFGFGVSLLALASDEKSCDLLLQQKQGDLAGQCFFRLAQAQGSLASLDALKKRTKGLFLEKAAKGFDLAGDNEKDKIKAALFYEEGAKALQQILSEKLCLKTYQCQATRGMLLEITQKIGYAKLTLTNPKDNVPAVTLRGYQYERTLDVRKQEILNVRPGRYDLEINFPGQPPTKLSVDLAPNSERLVAVAGTSKFPTGAWILGGIGLGIATVGGILLGRTLLVNNEHRKLHQDLLNRSASFQTAAKADQDKMILDSLELAARLDAESRVAVGAWLAFSVGSAMFVGGVVWLIVGRTSTQASALSLSPLPPSPTTSLLLSVP